MTEVERIVRLMNTTFLAWLEANPEMYHEWEGGQSTPLSMGWHGLSAAKIQAYKHVAAVLIADLCPELIVIPAPQT